MNAVKISKKKKKKKAVTPKILTCKCCGVEFEYNGISRGQPRLYCDKHTGGNRGTYGIGNCVDCGNRFMMSGRCNIRCKGCIDKKRALRPAKPKVSFYRKDGSGCKTCGGLVPRNRTDGYCSYLHNPEFLDEQERLELKNKYQFVGV